MLSELARWHPLAGVRSFESPGSCAAAHPEWPDSFVKAGLSRNNWHSSGANTWFNTSD